MRILEVGAYSLLELVAVTPLAYLPSHHRRVANKLLEEGLLTRQDGRWYATALGLVALGRTLH
jgi:hypothetical protein